MENLNPTLRELYRRDLARLSKTELPNHMGCVSFDEVLRGYYFLVEYFSGDEPMLAGLRDVGLLESAISRQAAGFAGVMKWKTPRERAATLFFGLVKNHAFIDGNKRLALLMLLHSLRSEGLWIKNKQSEWESLTVSVAASSLETDYRADYRSIPDGDDREVRFIAEFTRKNTRRVVDTYRGITFRELDRLLRNRGFELDEPHGNRIGVFQNRVTRTLLLRKTTKRVKLGSIGFPSWTKQVSKGDLRGVRELTGLTHSNGVDDAVFYDGNEPLFWLIADFEGPLKRLRDK